MELLALDSSFQPISYLPYFNLQWTREYYKIGQFSVQVAAASYDPAMTYLYSEDRPETGIIQKVELTETVKGRFVQLSGYFLEAILNDKVVYPTYYASGSIPATVVAMLRQYKDDIPLLTVADAPAEQADETSWQETGGQLADVAYTKLQTVQHSLRCRYDYAANTITAEVWQGLDRTQEQTENPFVTFSDGFGNLTEAEYLAGLQQKGLDELLNYQIIQNVDIQAAASGFAYLQDWDLGDKVDVIVEDIGLAMQARIVTVREVFKQNNHTVEIELGDKKLTDIQKARLIY